MSYSEGLWTAAFTALLGEITGASGDVTVTFYNDDDEAITSGGLIDKVDSEIDEDGNIVLVIDTQPTATASDDISYVQIAETGGDLLIRLPCKVATSPEEGWMTMNSLATFTGLLVQIASLTIPIGDVLEQPI